MSNTISREQMMNCLRGAGWKFQERGKRAEIWKKRNSSNRIGFPTRKNFDELQARTVLRTAKLTNEEIERFIREAIKNDPG